MGDGYYSHPIQRKPSRREPIPFYALYRVAPIAYIRGFHYPNLSIKQTPWQPLLYEIDSPFRSGNYMTGITLHYLLTALCMFTTFWVTNQYTFSLIERKHDIVNAAKLYQSLHIKLINYVAGIDVFISQKQSIQQLKRVLCYRLIAERGMIINAVRVFIRTLYSKAVNKNIVIVSVC